MLYNAPMNFSVRPSALFRFCMALILLFSLWASAAQDMLTHNVLENGDIVLSLDADSHADDSFEQAALISHVLPAIFISHNPGYSQQRPQPVLPNCFPPPDRPPAEFV